jgi:AcrR family transcriptional regulator
LAEAIGLREQGKQRRTEQILAAARDLLREEPGRMLSVDRIADRAQVAPATVFNLVGTREQIWAALMDQLLVAAQTRVDALPELTPRERARRVVTEYVRVFTADATVTRVALAHWSESGRLLRGDGTPELVACLRAAQDEGTLRADADVAELGALVATGCTGALHQWAAGMIGSGLVLKRCRAMVDLAFDAAG